MTRATRRSRACTAGLIVALAAAAGPAAAAQDGAADERPGFLTRSLFHIGVELIGHADPRFSWEANVGGEIDFVDYGRGRFAFFGNYQTILGDELRPFDPNQGNYTLDLSGSIRLPQGELVARLHHVSRHLSDRAKLVSVDWNMLGAELVHERAVGPGRLTARGRALWSFKKTFVDYRGELGGDVRIDYPLGSAIGALGGASLVIVPVDARLGRTGVLTGARGEGGVRLRGRQAAAELFLAVERRFDADPFELRTRDWAVVGLRLISR